jgi:hypothetical protein
VRLLLSLCLVVIVAEVPTVEAMAAIKEARLDQVAMFRTTSALAEVIQAFLSRLVVAVDRRLGEVVFLIMLSSILHQAVEVSRLRVCSNKISKVEMLVLARPWVPVLAWECRAL